MLLDFRPLQACQMDSFDGAFFAIPVSLVPDEVFDALDFGDLTFDYYLAAGRIDDVMELLVFGTLEEDTGTFSARPDRSYFVPLSLMPKVPAALFPHTRLFKRSPFILSVLCEHLKRKGQIAQRMDRSLDSLRIPDHPDSLLVFTDEAERTGGQVRAFCLDRLKQVGPNLYTGFVHDSHPADLGYRKGEQLYCEKILPEESGSPVKRSVRLRVLPEKPEIPKIEILLSEAETDLQPYLAICPKCGRHHWRHFGQEGIHSPLGERLKQEVITGLWGMELYAFALRENKVRLSSHRAAYHCRYCGSWETHRFLRLEALNPDENGEFPHEDFAPRCACCGHSLDRHDDAPELIMEPCRGCGETYIFRKLEKGQEEIPEPSYLPEDFDRLSLKEAALLSFFGNEGPGRTRLKD